MARTGKISLYEGVGKVSGKPFTALKLDISPTLSKLYFLESRFEMEHAVEWLKGSDTEPTAEVAPADAIDLTKEDDVPPADKGLFS